ncbi:MAG: hypothetical protein SXV54_13420 [Chloroflexota bacterium]|nr:hypothetical protein [Chloroflexota bacterium]
MKNEVPVITCSAQEMVFLAGSLGADTLLGVDDPFMGWLADEIEEAWKQAQVALAERRFIEIQPDEGIVMDVAVAAMVGTCAFPDASFVVTFASASRETMTHHLHVTRQLVVEQIAVAEPAATYQLMALEDGEAAYHRILEVLSLDGQQAVPSSGGKLPEAALSQAREVAAEAGLEEAQKVLQDAGLTDTTVAALAETLVDPIANGALVALARQETTWEVAGLGLLEGQNGLWRLRAFTRGGENWVEVIPCDVTEAREAIRRVMNRVLPERIQDLRN